MLGVIDHRASLDLITPYYYLSGFYGFSACFGFGGSNEAPGARLHYQVLGKDKVPAVYKACIGLSLYIVDR